MNYRDQNIIEATWIAKAHWMAGNIKDIPYEELRDIILDIAENFESVHPDTDWYELDYNEEIEKFTNKELAKELWRRFGDIPMNPYAEEIEQDWNGFLKGTFREDIWHWFEDTFNVSVAEDLMNVG